MPVSFEGEPGPVWPLGQAAGPAKLNIDNYVPIRFPPQLLPIEVSVVKSNAAVSG